MDDADPRNDTRAMPAARTELSARRAIQWLGLSLAFAMLALATLLAAFFWYLQQTAIEQQRHALTRDGELIQQAMRLRWREHQDEVVAAAQDWGRSEAFDDVLRERIGQFLQSAPDALYVAALDTERRILWRVTGRGVIGASSRIPGRIVEDSGGYGAFTSARDASRPVFSPPFLWDNNEIAVELHAPVVGARGFGGTLAVGYSLNRTLSVAIAPALLSLYQITIADAGGNELVSTSTRRIHEARVSTELTLDPPGHGMRLRVYGFDLRARAVEHLLLLAVTGLSIASVAAIVLIWRQGRRRLDAEAERDRLFTLSPDIICTIDHHGRFGRVNPALEQMFGRHAGAGTLQSRMHPDDVTRAEESIATARRSAQPTSFEGRFRIADQQWRWLRWSLRGDPNSAAPVLYAVAHDITQRHVAEQALAAESAFRQAMDDSVLTGMRAFDGTGRITYVNRAFCEMTGFGEAELVGSVPPYPYWVSEDQESHWNNFRTMLAGAAPASGFEVRVRRRDNSLFHARMYVSALVDRNGVQSGWMTSMTDITEPRRARRALEAAHERFTTVLDELDAAICVRDPGRALDLPLFANRRFQQTFGNDRSVLERLLEAGRRRYGDRAQPVFDTECNRWFEMHTRRITWVDGSPVELIVATDVTRRQESEQQHRDQQRKLQGTARLVTMGEMASSLAHEINQPLTAIANYCMGLSARIRQQRDHGQKPDPEQLLDALAKTSRQAERAAQVIRRIRDFVKRSEPEHRLCALGTIVADALGLAEIDAERFGVVIDARLPETLPSLHADPILLEQVLLNLLRNAVEATREREPGAPARVELCITTRSESIHFSVRDCGPGLRDGASERLYEPFFTTKPEGMGIGLNICRTIIESHQGRLWHEPNPDRGLSFQFTLPLRMRRGLRRAA